MHRTDGGRKWGLYWNTVRYLRFSQIFWRLYYRIRRDVPEKIGAVEVPRRGGRYPCAYVPGGQKYYPPDRFVFLNEGCRCRDWNDPYMSKLWLYNLHYFDDLRSQAVDGRLDDQLALIRRWIAENPQGRGNGWEPFPTSLRIVNWIIWDLEHGWFKNDELQSLACQTVHLVRHLEYHLSGNHLLKNAKALIFSGLYFEGAAADRWLSKGIRLWNRELQEQVLLDGGHFERSTMYHVLVLEDLLEVIALAGNSGCVAPELIRQWREVAERMMHALAVMLHPDGEIAFFNDASRASAPYPGKLLALGERLGIAIRQEDDTLGDLPETGYARMTCADWTLLVDAAPVGPDYLPGHAHADTLSFELSIGRERVFVNSGTSCYGCGEERRRQRQSPAHNTLTVDDLDSSEVWSGFRVARRARVVERYPEINEGSVAFYAAHDGYCRLDGVGVHRRSWHLEESRLEIRDRIEGAEKHRVQMFFHFAPEVKPAKIAECRYSLTIDSRETCLEISVPEQMAWSVEETTYHPEFGIALPAQRLRGECFVELPLETTTVVRYPECGSRGLTS